MHPLHRGELRVDNIVNIMAEEQLGWKKSLIQSGFVILPHAAANPHSVQRNVDDFTVGRTCRAGPN